LACFIAEHVQYYFALYCFGLAVGAGRPHLPSLTRNG